MARLYPVETYSFSGQGAVLMAHRDAAGNPMGFLPVGNCDKAEIALKVSTDNMLDMISGQRAIMKQLRKEVSMELSVNFLNFNRDNLAACMWAENTIQDAGTVTVAETVRFYANKIIPLPRIKISNVVITDSALPPVWQSGHAYTLNTLVRPTTSNNHFYKCTTAGTAGSSQPTWPTDGSTVDDGSGALVWTDQGTLPHTYADYTVNPDWGSINIPATTGDLATAINAASLPQGDTDPTHKYLDLAVTYSYETQTQIDGLVTGQPDRYVRFEGLNTAENNDPVIIEVFRWTIQPLAKLSMIQASGYSGLDVTGACLFDWTKTAGSPFFRMILPR